MGFEAKKETEILPSMGFEVSRSPYLIRGIYLRNLK